MMNTSQRRSQVLQISILAPSVRDKSLALHGMGTLTPVYARLYGVMRITRFTGRDEMAIISGEEVKTEK